MTSKRTKCRERLRGAGYKCQRLERYQQNMMGAAALQRFLVPVQILPQNSGQEYAIPDPSSDDNEIFEVEIPAIQLDNTGCNIRAVYYSNNKFGLLDNFYKNIYVLFVHKLLKVFLWGRHFRYLPRAALYLVTPLITQ